MRHLRTALFCLAAVLLAGCPQPDNGPAAAPAPRVVSFSPALTDMIFALGLEDHLVGVTTYCSLPPGHSRPIVGNHLNVRAEPILAVEPDLLLTQTAPAVFEPVRRLHPDLQIEHFSIETLDDIAAALLRVARLLGAETLGQKGADDFTDALAQTREHTTALPPVATLFVMDYQQPAGAGRGVFMDDMIVYAGGRNVLHDHAQGWQRVTLERIMQLAPTVLICQVGPEKADLAQAYWQAFGADAGWQKRVYVVTDARWTIPGPHLADLTATLAAMIHPELEPPREP